MKLGFQPIGLTLFSMFILTLSGCVEEPIGTTPSSTPRTIVVPPGYENNPYYYGMPTRSAPLDSVMPPGTCAQGITGTVYCNQR